MAIRSLLLSILFLACTLGANAQTYQWSRNFASSYSIGTDIVTDDNFNVISAGWFHDSVDLDPGAGLHWVYENSLTANYNAYLSKLDQNGAFVWGYTYEVDSTSYNRIFSIDVDHQNNILVLGQYHDSIDLDFGPGVFILNDNNSNPHWNNLFVAKYDPNGNLIWGKGLNSTNNTNIDGLWGYTLKTDGSNNIIISGRFHDTVDFDPGPGIHNMVSSNPITTNYAGNQFLLKLAPNGSFIWVRDWNNLGNWTNNNNNVYGGHELDLDTNNNIFFPVVFSDSMDVNPQASVDMIHSNGMSDVSFLKMSPSGSLVWHKEVGGPFDDYCNSLATDPMGNIFYSIKLQGAVPIDLDPGPGTFIMNWTNNTWRKVVLKLDNGGNFIWAIKNLDHNYGGSYGEGIATDTAGSIYLTTMINPNLNNSNSIDLNPGPNIYYVSSHGGYDIAFQNLDANGQFIWGGVMGGVAYDFNTDICTDKAQGVYMNGYFHLDADFNPTPDSNYLFYTPLNSDAFVVKLKKCNVYETQVYDGCDSVIYNNQVYYGDTTLQNHYPAWNGCDSVHSAIIKIVHYNDTLKVDTCNQYLWNGISYSTSGFYTLNYLTFEGCDSITNLDLTINHDTLIALALTDCDSALVNGVWYNTNGVYQQFYSNMHGCDSIYSINFTLLTVDTSITINGISSLQANATSAKYQWIDCSTMQPILGDTNSIFNAQIPGSYACIVTENGCTDTSSCYSLNFIPESVSNNYLLSRLYPNPSKGSYHLELDKIYKNVRLEIRNMSSQLIWKQDYSMLKETNININKPAGVYMLYIKQDEQTQVKKLLKW